MKMRDSIGVFGSIKGSNVTSKTVTYQMEFLYFCCDPPFLQRLYIILFCLLIVEFLRIFAPGGVAYAIGVQCMYLEMIVKV